MNQILELKGRFEQKANSSRPGAPKLPKGASVNATHLESLKQDLLRLISFWATEEIFEGALVSVYYNKIVAKSNRLNSVFANGNMSTNDTIVGAKFSDGRIKKHIITHYISMSSLERAVEVFQKAKMILLNEFHGSISEETLNKLENVNFSSYGISKSKFQRVVVDIFYVEKFDVETSEVDSAKTSIVTIYDTQNNTKNLLEKIGVKVLDMRIINETTVLLDEIDLALLLQKAPYLVAMVTENISDLAPIDFREYIESDAASIPLPAEEPTIGVIDTLFDDRVYFSEWVEFHNMIDSHIPIEPSDYKHGTAVSSIIVDGPTLNPNLDDGCGRFRVRHFGVATGKAFNSFTIIRQIKEIITSNPDIKVWNLSLGSNDEVNENFISAEGAVLDQIQFESDVIFVIAGTNKRVVDTNISKRIGAPADSINSMVVNSVDREKVPTSYSRHGIVLSFFTKPDVSYYGGSKGDYISVCEPLGKALVSGTSFATPWIARKLSYLIDIVGLNREVAKALIIDASIGWEKTPETSQLALKGHGVVPIRIEDIVNTTEDEIKFIVSGVSEKYETFNYNFPVPIHNGKHPYIAKATMCYFPKCSRNQGVDYTNTELDIYFGRINDKGKLMPLNGNKQSLGEDGHYLREESARKLFRKWDNIKHIKEEVKSRNNPKKVYSNSMWGMSIKTKERLNARDGDGIRFGVVVTLKEINGVNRIDDFIQRCSLKGWLVNRINVEERIDIYETANETIELE
ncbi:S8 family peptidase [Exiguobacterium acetylicum]|uniref:S8 family peptidase n=1 Tax=Exiguobacterium acetylicum TaxID=41170 RepID=UPI001EE1F22A|nr:S8 family peptidase [Exiguobacterium acetylicum]UKS55545.1 S8 family peptidase [Exiguobacterium acetylicum]